jgi:hypothetical protein
MTTHDSNKPQMAVELACIMSFITGVLFCMTLNLVWGMI